MKQFSKLFFVIVTITGITLVIFLLQLTRANAGFGVTTGRVANEPVPTLVEIARVPTMAPTFLPQTTLPATSPATDQTTHAGSDTGLIAVPPTFTPNTMPAGDNRVHIVQEGETLVQIADRFQTTPSELMALNKLTSANLDAGQVLLLPLATPTPATALSSAGNAAAATGGASSITVNGLPLEQFIIMPADAQAHVRAIFERGQVLGRNPNAFSIIGDSTVEMLNFLTGFETISYHLGNYAYLQRVLDAYPGSFARPRMAVEQGIHSRQVFLPDFADPQYCQEDETMIDCEWRIQNPSVVIIRIGSNDGKPELFETEVRRMVAYALERGTVPIIGTKADQYLDPGYVNNRILRQIAEEYQLPLWDFQLVTNTLPDNGLLSDRVHLTLFYEFDWRMAEAFRTGHGLQNLTALMALDAVLQEYESLRQAR